MRKLLIILLFPFAAVSLFASPKNEMRAAWIATVANIDWPSKDAVGNTELQQKEMIAILDSLHALHFNTVIFQVRPTADALYKSEYEPWSIWLSGQQGIAPDPYYDPLEFVVNEAHKRCLDVHVWLNPYRVTSNFKISEIADNHIYNLHPEWFLRYGDKYYFDPSRDDTRQWLNKIVADIVTRYDIDAIHFDDYFYPYKVQGAEFPDDKSFRENPRGFTNKADWRRNNVNLVIQELQNTIKSIKPWVEFGISPFGVWRNIANDPVRGSDTKAGIQNYDDLYADILLWLEKGWIDYVMPQLYWEIGKKNADFTTLLNWWAKYSYNKNLYIGVFASQLGNPKAAAAWTVPNELCRQIRMLRDKKYVDGVSAYSTIAIMQNRVNIRDSLRNELFRNVALVPVNRNITAKEKNKAPRNLTYKAVYGGQTLPVLTWNTTPDTKYYVVYAFNSDDQFYNIDDPDNILCITAYNSINLNDYQLPDNAMFMVTSVDKYHRESQPSKPLYTTDPFTQWLQYYK